VVWVALVNSLSVSVVREEVLPGPDDPEPDPSGANDARDDPDPVAAPEPAGVVSGNRPTVVPVVAGEEAVVPAAVVAFTNSVVSETLVACAACVVAACVAFCVVAACVVGSVLCPEVENGG